MTSKTRAKKKPTSSNVGRWLRDPEDLASLGKNAHVLLTADKKTVARLAKGGARISIITPDASVYARQMTQYGLVGMAMRLALRLGPINCLKLGFFAVPKAMGVLKKRMHVLVPLLVLADYLQIAKYRQSIDTLYLHAQMSDLALATDNQKMIDAVLSMHLKGVRVGLMTRNLGRMDVALDRWGISDVAMLCPAQSSGASMRPDKTSCEAIIKRRGCVVFNESLHHQDSERAYVEKLSSTSFMLVHRP